MEHIKCNSDPCQDCLDIYEIDYERRYGNMGFLPPSGEVCGWDLQPNGFRSKKEAYETLDYDNVPYGTTWKICGKYYELVEIDGKPYFRISRMSLDDLLNESL